MPLNKDIKKVLVIGSGPIVIGQAAEFDYAGTQACRALRDDGIEIVLVNSNPATIMTDNAMADRIYIEPLTLTTVKRIIEKEKPDSILSGFGGQTGLTLSMQLAKEGFLESHNVRLLGASPETIDKAEDRQIFKDTHGEDRPALHPLQSGEHRGGRRGLRPGDRLPCHHPPRFYPGRVRRRHCKRPGGAAGDRRQRPGPVPHHPGCWWRSASPAGRRSSSRSSGTARATASPCALWRTWTRWACTPATPSSSPRRSPFPIRSTRCSAPPPWTSSTSWGWKGAATSSSPCTPPPSTTPSSR